MTWRDVGRLAARLTVGLFLVFNIILVQAFENTGYLWQWVLIFGCLAWFCRSYYKQGVRKERARHEAVHEADERG